jgi:hypothetical protein
MHAEVPKKKECEISEDIKTLRRNLEQRRQTITWSDRMRVSWLGSSIIANRDTSSPFFAASKHLDPQNQLGGIHG